MKNPKKFVNIAIDESEKRVIDVLNSPRTYHIPSEPMNYYFGSKSDFIIKSIKYLLDAKLLIKHKEDES